MRHDLFRTERIKSRGALRSHEKERVPFGEWSIRKAAVHDAARPRSFLWFIPSADIQRCQADVRFTPKAHMADVQAIREGRLPKDSRFAALSALAKTMIEKRGRLDDQDVERFLAADFGKDHLLEVIAAVAASTITNYTGNITTPPLEAPFQAHAWAT